MSERKKALYIMPPGADERTIEDMGPRVFALLRQGYDVTVKFLPEKIQGKTTDFIVEDESALPGSCGLPDGHPLLLRD